MTTTRPEVLAVIPARGGSKGIPLKNLKPVAGRSLVARAIEAALAAPSITRVVVSTDHAGIADEARHHGADVVDRPADIAGDTATSESAVLHALDAAAAEAGADPEVVVFIQATSPFISASAMDAAVQRVLANEADSVFSVTEDHHFLWAKDDAGEVEAVGHSKEFRPRRQDRRPHYRETGAFYVMRTSGFRERQFRFFGRIDFAPVTAHEAVEIDDISDLQLCEALAPIIEGAACVQPIPARILVSDFDGVHTDDSAYVDENGVESVKVSRSDGMGVALLREAGVAFLILSKERNPVVRARAQKLKAEVLHGVDDKAATLATWLTRHDVPAEDVAYIGNDVNDLPVMRTVGWPIAVADAHPQVLAAARVVLSRRGGHGAVREACEMVIASQP